MLLRTYVPGLREGAKILPSEILGGGMGDDFANVYYVDGDNGSDTNGGMTPSSSVATLGHAVALAAAEDMILVKAMNIAQSASDPGSYAENVVVTQSKLKIIGISSGRTQGGLPQLKVGGTTTKALLTIQASGVLVLNMGVNGIGATGGGILIDDNGSTHQVIGTSVMNCHFKNCVGTTATNAATGGAIQWSAAGGGWQALIRGNRFYKNVGDVVLLGTSQSVPQDVIIEDNVFSGPAASVDCNLYLAGGSGMNGVIIRNNSFTCFPAIGAGTNVKQLALTGCVGTLSGNRFATSSKTFGAAGNNLVPTTVFMAENYQEVAAGAGATGEIGRT